tara:strand:+ start:292 stop:450 length:159 start_codon:yes stop_codon:yes gene_type:complete
MQIKKGRLEEIIKEEIQRFVKSTKKDIISEGKVSPEEIKKLLEELDRREKHS